MTKESFLVASLIPSKNPTKNKRGFLRLKKFLQNVGKFPIWQWRANECKNECK
jgi:hypothetical protein